MARLPQPGGDNGNWGTILNDYLSQALKTDGTIKDNAVTSNTIAPNAVTNASIASDAVNATSIADGSITNTLLADSTIAETKLSSAVQTKLNTPGTIGDGTITKAKLVMAVQTSLDKADTALQTAPVTSVAARTGAVTLTKTDVGLANVDNTADANKPVSTATQSALDAKAALTHTHTASQISDATTIGRSVLTAVDAATARTAIGAGTSNLVIGTTNSTAKAGDYVPTKADVGLGNVDNTTDAAKPVSTATQAALNTKQNTPTGTPTGSKYLRDDNSWQAVPTAADATTSSKGIVQLAGDLGGTSTAPTLAATSNVSSIISSNSTVSGALQKTSNFNDIGDPALAQLGLGIARKAGMVCDAQRVYGAAITSGSNVITLPAWAPSIQAGDVGKPCAITGAGVVIDASIQINTTTSSTSVTVVSGLWPSQILTSYQYPISGTGIPVGSSITITSTTAGTLSSNATATATTTALLIARSQTLLQNQYAPLVGFIGSGSSGSTINLVTTSAGSTAANASQTISASGSQNPSTFGSNAPTPIGTCIWGTDDTAAFQQAVYQAAALTSSSGSKITIPLILPGRCVISSSILWQDSSGSPAHRVSLHGYGHKVSVIHVIGNPAQGAIQKSPSNQHFEGVTFADFEIDGCGHSATAYAVGYKGLAFDTGMHMRYTNLYVHDFPATGIAADDNVDTVGSACESANNGRLQNGFQPGGSGFGHAIDVFTQETASWNQCIARLNGNHGLFFENNTNTVAGSSRGASVIGGQYYLNWNDGISDSGAGSLIVVGVQLFQNNGDGFAIRGPSFTETGMNVGQQGLVSGCQIFRNGGSGINYKPTNTGGTGTPAYTGLYTFTGNRIWTNSSCGVRIQVGAASTMANIAITDNDILTNVSPGILLNYFGSTGAVVTDLDIIGNRITGNGTGNTAGSDDGITVNVSVTGLRIKTNTITGSKGYGVNIGAGYTSATIIGLTMFGNDFIGSAANISGALSVNGGVTKTVWALRGNSGYNPVGSSVPGTAFALAATTVAWTNNTGVDVTLYCSAAGTVTAVSVSGVAVSGTMAVGSVYRVLAGGTFTVAYSSAPTLIAVGE